MPLIFERSVDTEAVIIALRGCNNEISYVELARQSGLTVARAKQVLASARNSLRSEAGVLFGVIRGEGLRRLSDADKVKKPAAFKKRVFRGAGRELKDLSTIANFGALLKTDQHKVTTDRTILHVIRQQAGVKVEPPKPKPAEQPMPNIQQLIRTVKKD